MNKNIKGALLSAFIFPGIGQFYLGKKIIGVFVILLTNVGLAGVIFSAIKKVKEVLVQLQPQLENGEVDFNNIIELSVQASLAASSFSEKSFYYLLILCWFFSVLHALLSSDKK